MKTRTDKLTVKKTKEYFYAFYIKIRDFLNIYKTVSNDQQKCSTTNSSPLIRSRPQKEEKMSKFNFDIYKTQGKLDLGSIKSPRNIGGNIKEKSGTQKGIFSPKVGSANSKLVVMYFLSIEIRYRPSTRPMSPLGNPLIKVTSPSSQKVKTSGRTSKIGIRNNLPQTARTSEIGLEAYPSCYDIGSQLGKNGILGSRKSMDPKITHSRSIAKRSTNTSVDARERKKHLERDLIKSEPDLKLIPCTPKQQQTSVKVIGRIRPLNTIENELIENKIGFICCQVNDETRTISFPQENFAVALDGAFGPDSHQANIYDLVGKPTVDDVLNGYNGTILAYGQTGSGKTYTMYGPDIYDNDIKGIIPRAAQDIFAQCELKENVNEIEITCAILELYKENLKDLLAEQPMDLRIKESPEKGIYVEGLSIIPITSQNELMYYIDVGEERRAWGETRQNTVSSRSHTILILEMTQYLKDGTVKHGVFNLVDLAGSEKVGKSGAQGKLFEEGTKINLSLSALGNVIHAITTGLDHIPYRDSKLTRLLQESLSGNFKTTLIVTCSPHSSVMQESISTLKFAQRAKKLKNKVQVNIKSSPEQLIKTIELLKQQLREKDEHIRKISMFEMPKNSENNSPPSESSKKLLKRSKSLKKFNMKISIASSSDDSSGNQIVVNLGRQTHDEHIGNEEILKLREQNIENQAIIEKFKRENIELRAKLRSSELNLLEYKRKLIAAESKISELEGKICGYESFTLISASMRESEETKSKILMFQDKALSDALDDADSEIMRLLKEKKEKIEKSSVELLGLSLSDYLHKNTIQSTFSDKWIMDLQNIGLDIVDGFIAPKKLFSNNQQIALSEDALLKTSKYADSIGAAVEEGKLSCETMNYLLKNQLLDSAIINHNLRRVISLITWKLLVKNVDAAIKTESAKVLQKTVDSLEAALENATKKYQGISQKLDELDYEMRTMRDFYEFHKEFLGNSTPTKPRLKKHIKNLPNVGSFIQRPIKKSETVRKNSCNELKKAIAAANIASTFKENSKINECLIDYNWQKTLAGLLMEELKNAREQISVYKQQVYDTKKSAEQLIQDEDKNWQQITANLKENYDNELTRKQKEIAQLHDLLAQWIMKYVDLQKSKGINENVNVKMPDFLKPYFFLRRIKNRKEILSTKISPKK